MSSLAFIPPVMALLAFLGGGRLSRRLPPATVVRLGTAFALTVAVMTGLVLSVAAVLSVAQLLAATSGSGSTSTLATHTLTQLVVGIIAAVVVTLLLAAAASSLLRSGAGLIRAAAAAKRLGPAHAGLVVVDDDAPAAFAVAGVPGRVVVSTAMLRALDAGERSVLLAHEAAHVRHHHHLYTQLAQLAAAANPLLRPIAGAVARGTERWADEAAAAEIGDREVVARGLARAALAVHHHAAATPGGRSALACYGEGRVLLTPQASESQLADRIRMLLAPPPQRAGRVTAAVVAIAVLCAGAGSAVAIQGHQQIEKAELLLAQDGR